MSIAHPAAEPAAQTQRLKVLLSSYFCEPGKGSEEGIGWNTVKEVSKHHDVWVIVRSDFRPSVERELARNPLPNVTWVWYDLPRVMHWWRKVPRLVIFHYYYLWQIGAYFRAKQLHEEVGFDVVHHITFGRYWNPSLMHRLGIPMLWGPVGGGESTPPDLYKTMSSEGKRYEYIRRIGRTIGHIDPLVRAVNRKATIGLATTEESEGRMRGLGGQDVRVITAMALPPADRERLMAIPFREEGPVRFLSVGELREWKGFHLGLLAFARVADQMPGSEFWVIGAGPQMSVLKELAAKHGVADRVKLLGLVPRDEVFRRLEESDVLVHPSMHDSGGWVCLEGMAAGRPVIVLDTAGPKLMITEETGFRASVASAEAAITEMADAMRTLASDRDLRRRMSEAGRERILAHYTWEGKGEEFADLYREMVGQGR